MPIYEYRCRNGHTFEAIQSMVDDPVDSCEECGAPVERVFHPIAVHFKGSGFYTTDYARKGSKSGGDGESKSDDGSDSSGSSKSESGSESESGSKSQSGSKSSEKTPRKSSGD